MDNQKLVAGHLPSQPGVYLVTPDFAGWFLENFNNRNRKVYPTVVARYASDMSCARRH